MPQPLALTSRDARWIRVCDRVIEFTLYAVFLLVPVVFLILMRDQFELPKLTVLRLLTAVMLGAWGARTVLARRFDWIPTPLDLPILAWVAVLLLTSLVSVSTFVSWLGEYENFRGLLTFLNYVALYYLLINFVRTREQIDRLLFTIVLSGLLVTAYGIAQFFGIDFIAWSPESIAPGRYFASLGNPNFLAAFLSMVLPLLVIEFVETPSAFRRGLLVVSFLVMFLALLGTWSRGGFLGLVAGLGVPVAFGIAQLVARFKRQAQGRSLWSYLGEGFRQHRQMATVLLGVLAVLLVLSFSLGRNYMLRMADTMVHLKDALQVSRLHIWKPALKMIRDYPLLGTGVDTFKTVFPRYAQSNFAAIDGANVSSRTAHNEVLQVLATQGAIGFLVTLWLSVMILRAWLKAFRLSIGRWRDRLILIGTLASFTAYSFQNLFSFGVATIDIFYWLAVAIFVLLQRSPEEQVKLALPQVPDPQPQGVFRWLAEWRPLVLSLVLVATVWLGWQGLRLALADYAYNIGTILKMQGEPDKGITAFEQSVRWSPHEVKYRVYLGLAYEEKAKSAPEAQRAEALKRSIENYQLGVRMNPTNAYYLANLGRIYSLAAYNQPAKTQEYYQKSADLFQQAIRLAPVTVLFYQNLAMTHLSFNNLGGFNDVVGKLAEFDPNEAAKLVFSAANQLYNNNLYAQALPFYQKAVDLNPNYVEAYFNLGVVLTQLQGPQAAIVQWRKALALRPDFEPARQMLERFHALPAGRL